MFLRTLPANDLEVFINSSFTRDREWIMNKHIKQWLEEDIREYSKVHYDIISYYAAIHLAVLIWLEFQDGINTEWSYYVNKYDIDCKKKCLACKGISLDNILLSFGFPITLDYEGIQGMKIETNFIVEPDTLTEVELTNVNINDLLDSTNSCYNYLNTLCSPITDSIINAEIPFIMPPAINTGTIYYGVNVNPTLIEVDVLALSSVIKSTITGLYSFNVGGYKWIAFPVSLGVPNLSNFIDNASQLNMVMEPAIPITINLSPYNLYRSTNILGGNITMKIT